ncbi:hypothetical protein [Leadbettera azotonutricia]|uniref:Uncharacterized protein n=1 Tax=Leadbettera azotonutricia (strain ATCC BAA-888 / DSM 13862 / ZAS-9) TaxID=545695 RepID=F5Y9M9_LEAAZ|nr:hypothetical protein [Leadbettera azotonutricia]AEF81885.1 hypothetical protein TREAZ_0802 [Leadbettera azotonutricia ZAS-9]
MKRVFTLKNEESDKFWAIETNNENLIVNFGKVKNTTMTLSNWNAWEQQHKQDPVAVRLGEGGSVSEKAFASAELWGKEAEKLIAKKIKAGFIEQDEFFISFFNEVRGLYNLNRPSKLSELLTELDKWDKPFVISYGSDHLLHSLEVIFTAQVKTAKVLSGVAAFMYHLPKLEGADEPAKNNLLSIYGVGLRCAAVCNDEKLDAFCRVHLPAKSDDPYIAAGLAYSAARWNRPDEVKENLKRAFFTYYGESESYEKLDFFKPYADIIEAYKKDAEKSG